ncbi:MAG: DUF1893 domain-containing protein [Bacillota bacterium]
MTALVGEDLQRARELLQTTGATVVAVCQGNLLGAEHGSRLLPLLRLIRRLGHGLAGASVADRVVGRAAALMLLHAGVAGVFGEVMSEGARQALAGKNVTHQWDELAPAITTPAGATCPMEAMVQDTTEPEEAFKRLERVLARFL